MKPSEEQIIRRAIALLSSLIDEPQVCAGIPWRSPVRMFVQEYLAPNPDADISCAELWSFFQEIVQSGELQPMRKSAFFRQLPTTMEAAYQVRRCHNVMRSGRRVRGFKGISIRMDAGCPAVSQSRDCASR